MKVCLIQQPSGLGDILLSIKIASEYASRDYHVIWPVAPVYSNLNEKLQVSGIDFVDVESDYPNRGLYENLVSSQLCEVYRGKNLIFLPLKNSFHSSWGKSMQRFDSHDASNMLAKFLMCNTTHDNWQDHFTINRDGKREQELFDILRIEKDFHLVNDNFGTPPVWKEKLNKTIETPPRIAKSRHVFCRGV